LRLEFESALRDLLYLEAKSSIVAERIHERLKKLGAQRPERRAFINFLLQTGEFKKAYELMGLWIPGKDRIPWRELLFLLNKSGYKPNREFLDYFFQAMDEVDPKDSVQIFQAWSHYDPRLADLETKYIKELKKQAEDRKRLHFEKLDYFRSHRMIQEEEKQLKELLLRFPENAQLKSDLAAFKARWAHHYVSDRARNLTEEAWLSSALKPKPEDWEFGNHLLVATKEIVSKKPLAAYDFAIGFYFMDLFHHAVEMIQKAPHNLATDWFRLEALLKGRRYLECLEAINEVEHKYSEDPESSFASTYLRAQVLRGLGQVHSAIELMKSIVNIRPSYRSAHSLLIDWEHSL
jgi:hypothetical protein